MLEDNNLGKFKERRNKTVKPYERPKSILRRVTDSVTGLLPQPSWLVNWLHSTPKDNESESPVEEELPVPSTSSSSNTDRRNLIVGNPNTESFIFQRPPGAFNDQVRSSSHTITPALIPEINRDDAGANLRDISIQTNGDDDSHSESTSGCSSLLPHPDHRRDNRDAELPKVEPLNIDRSALQLLGNSLSKSLAVDLKNNRGRKTLSLQTFSQSTSMAASPIEDHRFNKDSESASISSFYGKSEMSLNCSNSKRDLSLPQSSGFGSKRPRFNITSFGPIASDARKSVLNESIADSPFYAGRTTYGGASAYRRASLQPSTVGPYTRKRVQARPSSSAIPNASSSLSGNASTNLLSSSANRILQALESMSTPVRDAKRIPTNVSIKRSTSFQDEEPSFSGFGLSRRRPNLGPPASKLTIGTPAQIVSRPPPVRTTTEVAPVSSTPISAQAGGKMRCRKSAPPRQSAKEVARIREEEEPIQVELQAQPFGLSSLPNFNLLPVPPSTVPSASSAVVTQGSDKIGLQYPKLVSSNVNGSLSSPKASATFTFSAPIVNVNPSTAAAATIVSATQNFNFSSPLRIEASLPKSIQKNSTCDIQTVSELKTGSVLDALKGNGAQLFQKTSTGDSSEKLVTSQALPIPTTQASMGFGEMFKPPTNSWKCSICMVTNSDDQSTCMACEGPKPSVASSSSKIVDVSTTPVSLPKEGFGDKFKKPTGQWECPVCCVFNSQEKEKCLSCETQRPGTKVAAVTPSISNFKFGVPKTSEKTEEIVSSTVKSTLEPTTKPSTGFQFGSTSTPTESSVATDSIKKAAGFQFGSTSVSIESSAATDSDKKAAGFQFGSTLASTESCAATDSAKKAAGFQFGSTLGSVSKENNSTGFKLSMPAEVKNKNTETSLLSDKKATESTVLVADNGAVEITTGSLFKASSIAEGATSAEKKQNFIQTPSSSAEANTASSSSATGSIFGSGLFGMSTQSTSQPFGQKSTVISTEPKLPSYDFKSSSISSNATRDLKSTSLDTKADETILTGKAPSFLFPVATTTTTATSSAPPFSFQANNQNTFSFGQSNSEASKEKSTATSSLFGVSPVTTPSNTGFDLASSLAKKDFTAPTLAMNAFKSSASAFGLNSSVSSFGVPNVSTSSSLPISTPSSATGTTTTTGTANSNPVFSFGASSVPSASTSETPAASSSISSQSAGQPFAFGQTTLSSFSTGKEAQKSTAGLFGFPSSSAVAAASTSSITPPTAPSSFGFASLSGVSTNPTSTSSVSVPSVFSFGTATPTTTNTAPKEVSSIPFSFGTQQSQIPAAGSTPTFVGFGSKTSSTPFSFTGTPATGLTTAFGEGAVKPTASFGSSVAPSPFVTQSAGMFGAPSGSFSASTPVSQSPAFAFGASSAPPPAQQSIFNPPPSYSFGSGPTAVAGAPSQPINSPASVFTFGNPSVSNPAPSSFSAVSSFASGLSNPFDNSGSAGGGGPNRKIRKAVRRQR